MYFTGKRERVRESAREAKSRRVGECEMWKFVIFVFILRLAFQTILYFSSLRTQSSNQMRSDPLQIHKYVLQWCVFFWPSCEMLSFLLEMRLARATECLFCEFEHQNAMATKRYISNANYSAQSHAYTPFRVYLFSFSVAEKVLYLSHCWCCFCCIYPSMNRWNVWLWTQSPFFLIRLWDSKYF